MLKCSLLIWWCLIGTLLLINYKLVTASKLDSSKMVHSKDYRIINGSEASLGATKHQASIRHRDAEKIAFGQGHSCGGSLISENVVLSAAHCFLGNEQPDGNFASDEDYVVVMGNLNRFDKNKDTLIFDIKKTIKYSKFFDTDTLKDDIILIILNGSVPVDHPTVKPINLNNAYLANNTTCQVTGWGITENNTFPKYLMTVDVPIIDVADCRNKTEYGELILPGMMCAGYMEGQRDSCTSDSGGPLVCLGRQAGIVSWGEGCAQPRRPGVYVDVAFYKDWILKEIARHNATLPVFSSGTSPNRSIFIFCLALIFNLMKIYLFE